MGSQSRVLVTGGAGYVGSALVPQLLSAGHAVTVLDRYFYGDGVFGAVASDPRLLQVKGDIRDIEAVDRSLKDVTAVIHLACISNDPSYDLDPTLGKSINYDAFTPLVRACKRSGVRRFIYASSSSVYGVKAEPEVTEELSLEPLTDYSKFKALCEDLLAAERTPGFETITVRPSTVCGYAPRLRLDLVVNILTNQAVHRGAITVFGGKQMRPNIHINDMCRAYLQLLREPAARVDGQIFNVGSTNHTVAELAEIVRNNVDPSLPIEVKPTDDERSYKTSSEKIRRAIGWQPRFGVADAVNDLKAAFRDRLVQDPLTNPLYFNIKRMQELHVA
ncbi:MAG TPA: NAD-dependent epimerase/dehydratase family protein [Polyangia bacterium]